jgi:hypothetical protein
MACLRKIVQALSEFLRIKSGSKQNAAIALAAIQNFVINVLD